MSQDFVDYNQFVKEDRNPTEEMKIIIPGTADDESPYMEPLSSYLPVTSSDGCSVCEAICACCGTCKSCVHE